MEAKQDLNKMFIVKNLAIKRSQEVANNLFQLFKQGSVTQSMMHTQSMSEEQGDYPPIRVSFQMKPGQVLCLAGGFDEEISKLLRIVIGKADIRDGQVYIKGERIQDIESHKLNEIISYSKVENFSLFEKLNAIENIQIFSNLS